MGWVLPRTYVTGEVITAAIGNTHWRDNLRYLKGLDGDVTIEANIVTAFNVDGVDVSAHAAGDAYAQHSNNIGNHTHQTSGAQGNKIDHGAGLDGLSDDDHTQYALRTILTTRGDMVYRNATVWARLAKGTDGQFLKIGANDPIWADVPAASLTVPAGTGTQVFSGTSPNAWTDLNVSGTVGSNVALLLIKIGGTGGSIGDFAVRKNGDTDEIYSTFGEKGAAAAGAGVSSVFCILVVATDSSGIFEWRATNAVATTTVDIIAYIK